MPQSQIDAFLAEKTGTTTSPDTPVKSSPPIEHTPAFKLSVADRHNNPLNLKYGPATAQHVDNGDATVGEKATDGGRFLKFSTPEAGFAAAKGLLTGPNYGHLPLGQAMAKWSNSGYGGEILPSVPASTPINQMTGPEQDQLVQAMATREGYSGQQSDQQSQLDAYISDRQKEPVRGIGSSTGTQMHNQQLNATNAGLLGGVTGIIPALRDGSFAMWKAATGDPSYANAIIKNTAQSAGSYLSTLGRGALALVDQRLSTGTHFQPPTDAEWKQAAYMGGANLTSMVAPEIINGAASSIATGASAPAHIALTDKLHSIVDDISSFKGPRSALGTAIQDAKMEYQSAGHEFADSIRQPALDAVGQPTGTPTNPRIVAQLDGLGKPELVDALKSGDKIHSSIEADTDLHLMTEALKKNPDTAYTVMMQPNMSAASISQIQRALGPEVSQAMTAQITRDLLTDTWEKSLAVNPDTTGVKTGGKALLDQLTKVETEGPKAGFSYGDRLKLLMGDAAFDKLYETAKIAASKQVPFNEVLGHIGQWTAKFLPGKGLGVAPVLNYVSKLMQKPEAMTAIREYTRALGNMDNKRILFYSGRIQSYIQRDLGKQITDKPKVATPMPPPPG